MTVAVMRQETTRTATEQFVEWIVEMDDPDPRSDGWNRRRSITLTRIIDRAREAQRVEESPEVWEP